MDNNTPIKQVLAEFKQAFGAFEYIAVQAGTDLTVQSKGYTPAPTPRLEINADDYVRLAELKGARTYSKGVVRGILTLAMGKR